MPQEVDASTQNSRGLTGGGGVRVIPQNGCVSCSRHQAISLSTLRFGFRREKGLVRPGGKDEAKRERAGRRDLPSGSANAQCTRVPRTDSASCWVNEWSSIQSDNLVMYLAFFSLGS